MLFLSSFSVGFRNELISFSVSWSSLSPRSSTCRSFEGEATEERETLMAAAPLPAGEDVAELLLGLGIFFLGEWRLGRGRVA